MTSVPPSSSPISPAEPASPEIKPEIKLKSAASQAPLAPVTAPALAPFVHGFFTRRGGFSKGVYNGLNLGLGSNDEPHIIGQNRARVQAHLKADQLVTAHQTHSTICLFTDAPAGPLNGDALVTKTPGMAIGVLTADCAPILFADAQNGIIGAAHAGWRGAMGGIIEATIDCLCAHGARRQTLMAVIGPCISQPNYEVGQKFYDDLHEFDQQPATRPASKSAAQDPSRRPDAAPPALDARDFCARLGQNQTWHFDLSGYCAARLARAEVAHIQRPECTYGQPDQFFSYRYNTHHGHRDYGRQGSFIMIPPNAEHSAS